jgi:hypothetical protein
MNVSEAARKHAERIALEMPGIETVETRHRDQLDFHELHIRTLRDALIEAYMAGFSEARELYLGNETNQSL